MLKIKNSSICILLLLCISMPTAFVKEKIFFLTTAFLCSIIDIYKTKIKINYHHILILIIFPLTGILYFIYGLFKNNPGAIHTTTVMIAYPIIFTIICLSAKLEDELKLKKALILASILLSFVSFFYIFSGLFEINSFLFEFISKTYDRNAVIDNNIDKNYFKFTLPNISQISFLLPFLIILLTIEKKITNKILLVTAITSLFIIVILSTRRGIFLSLMTAPIITIAIHIATHRKICTSIKNITKGIFIYFFYIFIIAIIFSIFTGQGDYYFEQIKSIFDFSSNDSNIERRLQFLSLYEGISKNPFFGSGPGAAASYLRSETQPWAYELFYIAFIYHYGLFGFFIYALGVFFIIFNLIRKSIAKPIYIAYCCGLISFLISTATNPYISNFDSMWAIFIPAALAFIPVDSSRPPSPLPPPRPPESPLSPP